MVRNLDRRVADLFEPERMTELAALDQVEAFVRERFANEGMGQMTRQYGDGESYLAVSLLHDSEGEGAEVLIEFGAQDEHRSNPVGIVLAGWDMATAQFGVLVEVGVHRRRALVSEFARMLTLYSTLPEVAFERALETS